MGDVMAETGRKRRQTSRGRRIGLPARLGCEAFSLADRIGPPPAILTGGATIEAYSQPRRSVKRT